MSVRTPGYRPRDTRRSGLPMALLAAAVVLVAAISIGALTRDVPGPSGSPVAAASGVTSSPSSSAEGATASPDDSGGPGGTAGASAPAPSPVEPAERTAIVPVTHFRSAFSNSSFREVEGVLAGTSGRYDALVLIEREANAILATLEQTPPADPSRLILVPDLEALTASLVEDRSRLAFIRADEVQARVRALGWGRHALFGVDRVAALDAWTLFADLPPATGDAERYDPAAAWTLFAGGDVMLDRGVYQSLVIQGRGADFMFDGGTAEITSRYCCSSFGWELPRVNRTGNEGVVRSLVERADIAIANFENPAPNRFSFHTRGTVFTADPALIDGLANGGLDWVSLANNHIRDAGGQGVLETIENLEARGLAHGGAGENLTAARRPSILEAGDTRVGILAYDAIAAVYAAGPDRIGSAPLSAKACQEDVPKAREAGADVVVVFPHWGVEYDATPFEAQQRLARACLDAGADMIIGNHAHWAGAVEVYDGKPIWYALGNFIFDQTWSEPTMEGITLELTFDGATMRQATMRPHIILDKAQPNFLDPTDDGRVVMGQVFGASEGLLDW